MKYTREVALMIIRDRGEIPPPAAMGNTTWGQYALLVLEMYPDEPELADAIWEG